MPINLDPDTETRYRKGGKIMKKTPRKFSAGGAPATPAPKTPPPKTDRPSAEELKKMREQAAESKMERGTERGYRTATDPKRLGSVFKKGGKVRKFADGGETQAEDKDVYYTGRFKGEDGDNIYRRAYEQVSRIPSSIPDGTESKPAVQKPVVRKAAPKVSVAPSKKPVSSGGGGGAGGTEPDVAPQYKRDAPTLGNRGEKADFNAGNALLLASTVPAVRAASAGVKAAKGAYEGFKASRQAKGIMAAGKERASGERKANEIMAAGKERASGERKANEIMAAGKERASGERKANEIMAAGKSRASAERKDKASEAKADARRPKDDAESTMAGEGGRHFKRGGKIAKYARGGGVELKGKTRGKVV